MRSESPLPPQQVMERRRAMFLAQGWPGSAEVARRLHIQEAIPGQWARERRRENSLLGAWSPAMSDFVHPGFQFLGDHLNPRLSELMAALGKIPGFGQQDEEDRGGWRRVFWMYQPRSALSRQALAKIEFFDGKPLADKLALLGSMSEDPRTPAGLFIKDPSSVINLALDDAKADTEPL